MSTSSVQYCQRFMNETPFNSMCFLNLNHLHWRPLHLSTFQMSLEIHFFGFNFLSDRACFPKTIDYPSRPAQEFARNT